MSAVQVPIPQESQEVHAISSAAQVELEAPPNGGLRAWTQVGVVFAINAFTWGQTAVSVTPNPQYAQTNLT